MEPKKKRVAVVGVGEETMFTSGPRLVITLPSGLKVSIREINGEDEDVVSRLGDNKAGVALYKFLANIVEVDDKKVTLEEVKKWRVRDIYYALMKIRIYSHGSVVVFTWEFQNGDQFDFTEDLGYYDWNLAGDAPPKLGEPDYDKRIIQPYANSAEWVEFELTSKKKCRFKYLTGEDEVKSLKLDENDLSINDKLKIRGFELFMAGGAWQAIERFNIFTAREMKEIRAKLETADPEFSMVCELVHPTKPIKEEVSLIATAGFFFPRA